MPTLSVEGPSPWSPGFVPVPSTWDLWYTKWQRDRIFSEYFSLPTSVSLHLCPMFVSICMFHLAGEKGEDWVHPTN